MLTITKQPYTLDELFSDGQWCPICHGTEFEYTLGMDVVCSKCWAEFVVRPTNSDPGVTIACKPHDGSHRLLLPSTALKDPDLYREDALWLHQVIKPCDDGLESRRWWTTYWPERKNLSLQDPPRGIEIFCYSKGRASDIIAQERWKQRTKLGREYGKLLEAGADIPNEMYGAASDYSWRHKDEIKAELPDFADPYVYFLAEQCERIWRNDGYWVHTGRPKPGEQPLAVSRDPELHIFKLLKEKEIIPAGVVIRQPNGKPKRST